MALLHTPANHELRQLRMGAMGAIVRKFLVVVETIRREMGRDLARPTRKAAALAVIENPFAGRHAPDLEELMQIGEELGGVLGEQAVAALGVAPAAIESYGKAAIVGEAGELEHAAAILHPRLGKPLRQAVDTERAVVLSTAAARSGSSSPSPRKTAVFMMLNAAVAMPSPSERPTTASRRIAGCRAKRRTAYLRSARASFRT